MWIFYKVFSSCESQLLHLFPTSAKKALFSLGLLITTSSFEKKIIKKNIGPQEVRKILLRSPAYFQPVSPAVIFLPNYTTKSSPGHRHLHTVCCMTLCYSSQVSIHLLTTVKMKNYSITVKTSLTFPFAVTTSPAPPNSIPNPWQPLISSLPLWFCHF